MNEITYPSFKTYLSDFFKENKFFFIPYLIFLAAGIPLLAIYPKGEILLWINRNHTWFLDDFFFYATQAGNGLYIAGFFVIISIVKFRYGIFILSTYITSGLTAQIIKFIAHTPRPKAYFGNGMALNFVEGISVYSHNSFPSGHSASAFALFLVLALITRYKPLGALYFIFALTVAISRVYVVQHFFVDIYFGSIVGVILTILTIRLLQYIKMKKKVKWL